MSKVTRKTVEIYRVHVGCDWATIVVDGWQSPGATGCIERGEVLVHSSFGSFAYQWSNLGRSIKLFLVGTTFDYFMGKMLGRSVREFDFDASLAAWKRILVAARRSRSITQGEFREIWDETCGMDRCGAEAFVQQLVYSQPRTMRDHPLYDDMCGYIVSRDNPQAIGFWREIWPVFVEQLRNEMTPANDMVAVA